MLYAVQRIAGWPPRFVPHAWDIVDLGITEGDDVVLTVRTKREAAAIVKAQKLPEVRCG